MASAGNPLKAYLQQNESVLKALGSKNLKACLRTGVGTRGHEANRVRAKHYRNLNRLEKQFTPVQKAMLEEWERRLCSEAEDSEFARLVSILENREEELQQMRKPSLEACFGTRLSNRDEEFGFGRNFLRRRSNALTSDEEKVLQEWRAKVCCRDEAVDAEGLQRFLSLLEARAAELAALRKPDLKAILCSHACQKTADLKYWQIFWARNAC